MRDRCALMVGELKKVQDTYGNGYLCASPCPSLELPPLLPPPLLLLLLPPPPPLLVLLLAALLGRGEAASVQEPELPAAGAAQARPLGPVAVRSPALGPSSLPTCCAAAFPEEQFDRLEALQPVWVPYYVVSPPPSSDRILLHGLLTLIEDGVYCECAAADVGALLHGGTSVVRGVCVPHGK